MTNETPPLALLVLFPFAFVAMWLGMGALLSALSGWSRLARAFPGGPKPSGPRIHDQVMGMGFVGEKSVTRMIPTAGGLYLHSSLLFGFRRPPILVPWAEIRECGESGFLWWRNVRLELGYITTLRVRPKALPILEQYLSPAIQPLSSTAHVPSLISRTQ